MNNTIDNIAAITTTKCHVIFLHNCDIEQVNDTIVTTYDGLLQENNTTLYEQFVTIKITKSQQQECITFIWRNSYHMSALMQLTIDADCSSKELSAILQRIEDDFC